MTRTCGREDVRPVSNVLVDLPHGFEVAVCFEESGIAVRGGGAKNDVLKQVLDVGPCCGEKGLEVGGLRDGSAVGIAVEDVVGAACGEVVGFVGGGLGVGEEKVGD